MKMRMNALTLQMVNTRDDALGQGGTHSKMMLKRIRRLKWKMLAIPKAKPRMMHNTPSLLSSQSQKKYCLDVVAPMGLRAVGEMHTTGHR